MMDKKVLIVAVGCLLWLAAASGVALGQAEPAKGAEPEAKIPDDPKVIRDMAPTALAEKNYKLAAALYKKLVERYPKNLDYRYSYGLSLMGTDNKSDAEKIFNEVLNMDPDNLNAFFQLARLNALRGGKKNMQKARDYLKQAARQGYAAISAIYNYRELKPFEAEITPRCIKLLDHPYIYNSRDANAILDRLHGQGFGKGLSWSEATGEQRAEVVRKWKAWYQTTYRAAKEKK